MSLSQRFDLKNPKLWWAVLIVYWLVLAITTHLPGDFPGVPTHGWDKLVHLGAFAVLAMLLAKAWPTTGGSPSKKALLAAWAVIIAYAALDEWTQTFVGRYASFWDWLADACGAGAGLAMFAYARRRFFQNGLRPN